MTYLVQLIYTCPYTHAQLLDALQQLATELEPAPSDGKATYKHYTRYTSAPRDSRVRSTYGSLLTFYSSFYW